MTVELTIEPECGRWAELVANRPAGQWRGRSLESWRRQTRGELGLATDRPLIATGHQTLLWHPGILAKYLAVAAMTADRDRVENANLVVDQHTSAFGRFEVPVRGADGSLAVRTLTLTSPRPDVPMGRHPAFSPDAAPGRLEAALPCVQSGIERILAAVAAHRRRSNAAQQMAAALGDLMSPWVPPMPNVLASDLIRTSLARAMIRQMADDPRRCAACYNQAVHAVPEAGIGPLAVTEEYVELPLWRIGPDDRRQRAKDRDVRRWLEEGSDEGGLLPRALFLTALVRLGLCDLFVHGTGGARYDRAMERWSRRWLGVEPCPIAVATANLRLPLAGSQEPPGRLATALQAGRRVWHDPEVTAGGGGPGPSKRALLAAIDAAPRRSKKRQALFGQMHERLSAFRRERGPAVEAARELARTAARHAAEAPIVNRRTWPFPLYPDEMIDALAEAVAERVGKRKTGNRQ
jgi:hypothetical protein